jgi:hypothetical protein
MSGDPSCTYCGGAGLVSGNADDVDLVIECVCAGGIEEAVWWLLGLEGPPADEPRIVGARE